MYLLYLLAFLNPFFVTGIPISRVSDQERWIIVSHDLMFMPKVLKRHISSLSMEQHYQWLKEHHSTTHTIHQKWDHPSLSGYSITAHSATVQKIKSHHAVKYVQKENAFKASSVQKHASWGLSVRISKKFILDSASAIIQKHCPKMIHSFMHLKEKTCLCTF